MCLSKSIINLLIYKNIYFLFFFIKKYNFYVQMIKHGYDLYLHLTIYKSVILGIMIKSLIIIILYKYYYNYAYKKIIIIIMYS